MGTADPIKDCEFANFWKRKSSKTPKSCANRKSNPGQMLGRHLCYHYTIGALNLRFRVFSRKAILPQILRPLPRENNESMVQQTPSKIMSLLISGKGKVLL
jgi:hypothetical protein